MCYSLEASFAVGAALTAVGFATIRKALRSNRSMLVFAFFPAVFSLHQFIEGIVWFSIEQPFHASAVFRYSYILIAFLVWPVLAPLAAAVATTDHWWRRVWVFMFVCGLALAGYLSMKLAGADGIEATVLGHSISYVVKYQTRPPSSGIRLFSPPSVLRSKSCAIGVGVLATFVYSFLEMRESGFRFGAWPRRVQVLFFNDMPLRI